MGVIDTVERAWVLCGCHIQNDWVEQRICIKFCIKVEHDFAETIWVIQKPTAMGTWWLAASSQQHTCSCITSCAEFFGKTSNHSGDSTPLQPRFGALWLLTFPKTKITSPREEISDHQWDSGIYDRAAVVIGRTVWGHKVPAFKGLRHHCPVYHVSVYHVYWVFFSKCLSFAYYMAGYLLDRSRIVKRGDQVIS